MAITVDFRRMIPPISREVVDSYRDKVRSIHADLVARRKAGALPFFDLPRQDLGPIEKLAARLSGGYKNVVVLGIGGSALGLLSLNAALRCPFPALEPAPRLAVMDNIDPVRIGSYLEALDPRETVLNVITKSGDTAETMSEFLIFRKWFTDSLGAKAAKDRIIVTTDRTKGALRKIANDEGYASFEVPDGVGGRFSVLSPVGLLPAALLGIDIRGLLAGAASNGCPVGKRGAEREPRLPGSSAPPCRAAGRQADFRHVRVLRPALPHGRLVPPALGGEPRQAHCNGRKDRFSGSHTCQGTRRHGPALAGPTLQGRGRMTRSTPSSPWRVLTRPLPSRHRRP